MAQPLSFRLRDWSSQDDVDCADNLLVPESYKKWQTAEATDKAHVTFEMEKPSKVASVQIGNWGSPFVEILVASQEEPDAFQVLVPLTTFMRMSEVKDRQNLSRERTFGSDKLNRQVSGKEWSFLRIRCSNPFTPRTPLGLAYVRLEGEVSRQASLPLPKERPTLPSKPPADAPFVSTGTISSATTTSAANRGPATATPNPAADSITRKRKNPFLVDDEEESVHPRPSTPARSATVASASEPPTKVVVQDRGKHTAEANPLAGVVLVISGIVDPDRRRIREQALQLGAQYRPDWGRRATHLVSAFRGTPKYNEAIKSGGKVVRMEWVYECFRQKKKLPESKFSLESDSEESSSDGGCGVMQGKALAVNLGDSRGGRQRLARPAAVQASRRIRQYSQDSAGEGEGEASVSAFGSSGEEEDDSFSSDGASSSDDWEDAVDISRKKGKAKNTSRSKRPAKSRKETHVKRSEPNEAVSATESARRIIPADIEQLPDFFVGKHFFLFGGFKTMLEATLKRYILAYGGILDPFLTDDTHYAVTESGWQPDFDEALNDNPALQIVTPAFVRVVHEKQSVIQARDYRVPRR